MIRTRSTGFVQSSNNQLSTSSSLSQNPLATMPVLQQVDSSLHMDRGAGSESKLKKDLSPRARSAAGRWSRLCFCLSDVSVIKGLKYTMAIGTFFYILVLCTAPSPLQEHYRSIKAMNDQLTVVVNTFRRLDLMQEAVEHYAKCPITKYVYIIWSEKNPPPERITAKYAHVRRPQIFFSSHAKDSLNNRFKPLLKGHTDAIFAVDDDMRVSCGDLELAYETWRGAKRTLVGFMPRLHLRGKNGQLVYRCWWRVWWHGVYSIILTKAAIMHHDFFDLYTNMMPQAARDLVDSERNCEDIAMQFLIANHTQLPPIYVKGHVEDLGVFSGISTSNGAANGRHMGRRSECLNELSKIFGHLPLLTSHIVVDAASNGWTNMPSSWWEFISSDLWKLD